MQSKLASDIKFLPGVGEKRASLLASELGVRTFGDLLYYFPFRHIDRTRIYRITDIGEEHTSLLQIRARVMNITTQGVG
ncbi:MAG: ATP-dependent DNA helicase RecG, partial [Tidjanibacter sp.]|nr:ATP-dependent DNA helicase RecG [Tidjanibacter sp.]